MRSHVLCLSLRSFLLVFAGSTLLFSQNQPPSNPQAVALASQSISALTSGNPISDVTLTGTVTWSGGTTPETGTATLLALGTGESRLNFGFPIGTWTEIRDASTGAALGEWIAPSGTSGLFAYQNCATDAVWFFPALGSLAAGPNVVLNYIGQETRNGEAVQHIQSYIYQSNPTVQQWSTMDFYLDATTLLPAAVTFNAHPDNSAIANLLVEVDFSNYQTLDGVMMPTQIQRSLQGNVLVALTITGAAFNTGLPLSDFTIN
jgi:hypothetical protein